MALALAAPRRPPTTAISLVGGEAELSGREMLSAHLQSHATELRRLPASLQLWAEEAMDEVGVDDAPTRRAVLAPLTDVGVLAARAAASAAELAATGA